MTKNFLVDSYNSKILDGDYVQLTFVRINGISVEYIWQINDIIINPEKSFTFNPKFICWGKDVHKNRDLLEKCLSTYIKETLTNPQSWIESKRLRRIKNSKKLTLGEIEEYLQIAHLESMIK